MDPIDPNEVFVRYQARHQERVLAFILTMVPNSNDAQEILQETSIVLWRKFSDFQIGSDYAKWATAVARFEIHKFRDRQKRDARILSEEVLARLDLEFPKVLPVESSESRDDALQNCLGKLRDKDRELMISRYYSGVSTSSIAEKLGRTVESVCNSMRRVRNQLLVCIEGELN